MSQPGFEFAQHDGRSRTLQCAREKKKYIYIYTQYIYIYTVYIYVYVIIYICMYISQLSESLRYDTVQNHPIFTTMAWTLTPRNDGGLLDVHRSEFLVDGHRCTETLVQWKGGESSLVAMMVG